MADSLLGRDIPRFTGSFPFFIRELFFIGGVGLVAYLLFQSNPSFIIDNFNSNPWINGLIVFVFLFGVLLTLRGTLTVAPCVAWMKRYARSDHPSDLPRPPSLIAPMGALLMQRSAGRISASSLSAMLDSVAARIGESGETTRYVSRLLIFLGLLGTFWGLLLTVSEIGGVIRTMDAITGDATNFTSGLIDSLQKPLGGMKTAFASSLFGLAGSLVVGFLELQTAQAQNRFFNELEEWMSRQARVMTTAEGAVGDVASADLAAASTDALAHIDNAVRRLNDTMSRMADAQAITDKSISDLVDELKETNVRLRDQAQNLGKIAQGAGGGGLERKDVEALQGTLDRIARGQESGRDELLQGVRSELKLLARNLADLLGGGR